MYINYVTYEIAYYWQDLTMEEGDEIALINLSNIDEPIYSFIYDGEDL